MSSLLKPGGVIGTAVDPSNPFGGTSGVLIDPITELTQPGGPFPAGTVIATDGLGGYTFSVPLSEALPQVVTVSEGGVGADFATIAAAIASISDSSAAKPYMIRVAPGVYSEANPLVLPVFVNITSMGGAEVTIIEATVATAAIIEAPAEVRVIGLTLRGASGVGGIGLKFATGGAGLRTRTDRCIIEDCETGILATGANVRVFVDAGVILRHTGETLGVAYKAEAGAQMFCFACRANGQPGVLIGTGFYATGANSLITTNAGQAVFATNGLQAELNGKVIANTPRFEGCVNNRRIGPGADGFITSSAGIGLAMTWDVLADGATAIIDLGGDEVSRSKISTIGSTTINGFFADHDAGAALTALGELWLGTLTESVPLASYSRDTISTGYVSGGVVTRNAGLTVDVTEGVGYINTGTGVVKVVWSAATALALTLSSENWVSVNMAGVVSAGTFKPSHDDVIILATAHTNATTVQMLAAHRVELGQHLGDTNFYAQEVVGPILVSGVLATKNATALRIDVDAGSYYVQNERRSVAATAPITFTSWHRDGSGSWTLLGGQTTVDDGFYDTGTGSLVAITVGQWKRDLLFVSDGAGDAVEYHVVYGQELFASQIAAESGNNPVVDDLLLQNTLRLAGVIVQQGAGLITSLVDDRPQLGQLATGLTAVTDHGLLGGLGDDDHAIYQLRTEEGSANGYCGLDASGLVLTSDLPAAIEGAQGALEIATQPETDTGFDDVRAVTPLKLATSIQVKRHIMSFSTGGGVPNAGARYLDREGIAVTAAPVLLPAAAVLIGITVTVDGAAGAGRDYEIRVISNPGGTDTLIGTALTLTDPAISARRRDLSAAIADGVLWGVVVVRTVGAGSSTFTDLRVELEVQMP